MGNRTAFIGHRHIFDKNISEKLRDAIIQEINNGCKHFVVGTHGDFDRAALNVCRKLREDYKDINIDVVITSLSQIKYNNSVDYLPSPYSDTNIIMYEIEDTHFKRKIIESNKQMIDSCDTLICFVDENYKYSSGAKNVYQYAKKKGLHIVNLHS